MIVGDASKMVPVIAFVITDLISVDLYNDAAITESVIWPLL
jgi:hypothetical protein